MGCTEGAPSISFLSEPRAVQPHPWVLMWVSLPQEFEMPLALRPGRWLWAGQGRAGLAWLSQLPSQMNTLQPANGGAGTLGHTARSDPVTATNTPTPPVMPLEDPLGYVRTAQKGPEKQPGVLKPLGPLSSCPWASTGSEAVDVDLQELKGHGSPWTVTLKGTPILCSASSCHLPPGSAGLGWPRRLSS